jgi:hypothetical protein
LRRVPDDLPEVAVGIAEVPRIDPPGAVVRLVGHGCTGGSRSSDDRVDLVLARNDLADAELTGLRTLQRNAGVLRQLRPRPDGQDESALQLEHRDGACGALVVAREFGAEDARRIEPEAVAVERERPLEIVDRERDDIDAGFHLSFLPIDRRTRTKSSGKKRPPRLVLTKSAVFSQMT